MLSNSQDQTLNQIECNHKLSLTSDTASWKHFTLMFSLSFLNSDHAPTIAETAFKVNRISFSSKHCSL